MICMNAMMITRFPRDCEARIARVTRYREHGQPEGQCCRMHPEAIVLLEGRRRDAWLPSVTGNSVNNRRSVRVSALMPLSSSERISG